MMCLFAATAAVQVIFMSRCAFFFFLLSAGSGGFFFFDVRTRAYAILTKSGRSKHTARACLTGRNNGPVI